MGVHAQHRQLVAVRPLWWVVGALACVAGPVQPTTAPTQPGEGPAVRVVFDPIAVPRQISPTVTASPGATVNGVRVDATWRPLLREGQVVDGTVFGEIIDEKGRPLAGGALCGHADFGGFVRSHGALWHFAHIECVPGAIWLSRVEQGDDGALTPVSTAPVDLSSVHGGQHFCAADITDWGSLLSAEEYDADARRVLPSGALRPGLAVTEYDPAAMGRYLDGPRRLPYVYDHGWMVEVSILDDQGTTSVAKRYAMGRFSHEIGVVLPDRRTVYMSDDGANGGLFLFVAARPGDLSEGTLYAARWEQESAEGGGSAALAWVSLGSTSDAHVGAALRAGALHYDEIMEHVAPVAGACTEGFVSINDSRGHQCVRLKPGSDPQVASRIEARRVAAMRGATTEISKGEGMAYDPDRDWVYLAVARVELGMLAGNVPWDVGGPDHVRLPPNHCGGVYALPVSPGISDTDGAPIDSPYVATRIDGLWMGEPTGPHRCALDGLANPDNITYLPGSDVLMVAEDSGYHPNNLLWALDVGAVERGEAAPATPVLAVPPGAEVTGTRWFPDIGGFGYLTTTVQHPWKRTPMEATKSVEERMGTLGTFGPFPALVPPGETPLDAPGGSE